MADEPKPMAPGVPADAAQSLESALERSDVPKIYANGFGLALSNADVAIVFHRFGSRPVAIVNLSYTLAKTLAQRLGRLVSEFEEKVGGQPMLTTEKIDDAFKLGASPEEKKHDIH